MYIYLYTFESTPSLITFRRMYISTYIPIYIRIVKYKDIYININTYLHMLFYSSTLLLFFLSKPQFIYVHKYICIY